MDMSKYRDLFFSETREHLRSMGEILLALEKNSADGNGIHALFREAHSVKGMAASMGYEGTAQLAHYLEDLLDCCRKNGSVPAETADRILSGVDLLEGLLEDLAADRPERSVAEFIAAAEPVRASESPGESEAFQVRAAGRDQGLLMTVELAADAAAPAARALLVLRALGGAGKVLLCRPSEEELARGGAVPRLELCLETDLVPDRIREILGEMPGISGISFEKGSAAPAPSPGPPREEGRTVRVGTDLLDRFINLTGELLTNRYMLQTACREERWEDVREGLNQLAKQVTDLHHNVLKVRMMPLDSITGRLPRTVRDLARKSGKNIGLRIEGAELELDRAILEELADPLLHMVRNAADHGIEKSGEITIRAIREKDQIFLSVTDNGRGIDPAALRARAVEKGLITDSQARTLRDRDALQLVCHPGFSTATKITDTSGRGVGMDVVKSAVEKLGGTLEIHSQVGKGTRFLLKLPLSVAIIQILLVDCDRMLLGIPISRIIRTLEIDRDDIEINGRRRIIRVPGERREEEEESQEEIPLLSLRRVLGLSSPTSTGGIPVVLTEVRGRKCGLVVDRLAGHREVFVKNLAFPLNRFSPGGASILGDGRVVFLLDPQTLLGERNSHSVSERETA